MADLTLDKNRTVVLAADFHTEGMGSNPMVQERQTLQRAQEVLTAARSAGTLVAYIVVNFRPGYPEISDRNRTFSQRKASGQPPPADPVSLIHSSVLPQEGEPVIVKHRVNAFYGTDLAMILGAHNIDTLVLMGHATSGVILSTVRFGADADYRLVVVEDGCADPDPEVHDFLMQRIFPRQAAIASAAEVVAALAGE
ncbi:MAG: cysteine hydrolase [Chloroflexota bacterium]|nr:cysteine hydrolase [Chloroflexota bacterium]